MKLIQSAGQQVPPAGIVSGGQPQYRKGYSIKIGPGITKSLTEITPPKPEKPFEQKLTETQRTEQTKLRAKTKEESGQEYRKAAFKMLQSTMLFNRMNDWNKKNLGMDITPAFGARGATNLLMGKVMKANPYVETFEGDRYTTAMALMRAVMPGRAEKMIEGVKKTLPSIWSSDKEASEQIVNSLRDAMGTYISKNPNEFPHIKKEGDFNSELMKLESKMRKIVSEATQMSVEIPVEGMRDEGVVMVGPNGDIEIVPYKKFTAARFKEWRPLTADEVKQATGRK